MSSDPIQSAAQQPRAVCGEALLGDVLRDYLRVAGIRKNNPVSLVTEHWRELVGEEVAGHTLIKGYQKGVLGIEVDSAPWLQELASFRKQAILERITEVLPQARVRDLRFTIRG